MPERSLKSQNWVYVTPYIIFNVIAFYVVVTGTDDVWRLTETALTSVAWSVASGFTALILNGILGGDFKAILVFWRIKHALPGCRAFSEYLETDPRINPSIMESHYGELPADPVEQNRLWYRIYQRHESHPAVRDSHRNYLATRDLTALSVIFLATLAPAAAIMQGHLTPLTIYIGALAGLYGLTSQAARMYGRRFVTTVLAVGTGS